MASLLGIYNWDIPGGPGNIALFEQWLGKSVDLAEAFVDPSTWAGVADPSWQTVDWGQWVAGRAGRNFIYSVPVLIGPWDRSGPDGIPGNADDVSYAKLNNGDFDAHFQGLADNLVAKGLEDAYIRLGWEMDGGWYTWRAEDWVAADKTGFKNAFSHIVGVMRARQPSATWKFILNPTTNNWGPNYLSDIYPGDGVVDLIGIDVYDQTWVAGGYPYQSGDTSLQREARQDAAWNDLVVYMDRVRDFAILHSKPMCIPEWGVCTRPDDHGGGDDPRFIQRMYDYITNAGNNVEFHSYFNVSFSGDINARLTQSVTGDSPSGPTTFPQAAQRFKELFGVSASLGMGRAKVQRGRRGIGRQRG